jgi:hypothetical protein
MVGLGSFLGKIQRVRVKKERKQWSFYTLPFGVVSCGGGL